MVYYGRLSKGCERCRKRKVKCDQAKPECGQCQVSSTVCPGYRDLVEVMFRDETSRIKRKSHLVVDSAITDMNHYNQLTTTSEEISQRILGLSMGLTAVPSIHIKDIAAGFYFMNYTFDNPPLSKEYNEWLLQAYQNDRSDGALRSIIDAVGLAALANIYHAPDFATVSKERYCHALGSVRSVLQDPVAAAEDTIFMTVILLGLYETVNLATWDQYHQWDAHVQGAITLLSLRGTQQFSHERGGQLFIQIRSQILLACMQQIMAVPSTIVELTKSFEASPMRHNLRRRNLASAGSIAEMSFRVVNLRAATRNGEITDPMSIHRMWKSIDRALSQWKTATPSAWVYVVCTTLTSTNDTYNGKYHTYPTVSIAEILNNWRTLRIIVNQMILQNAAQLAETDGSSHHEALATISELSDELCASVTGFANTPRRMSLIRPMYLVAISRTNPTEMRQFAIRQLRIIGAKLGIRQASLLAETVSEHIRSNSAVDLIDLPIPLLPCG